MQKKLIKVGIFFLIFAVIFSGLRGFYNHYHDFLRFKNYPSFDSQHQRYHTTPDILRGTTQDGILNTHYISHDLTPDIEIETLKIIGYGPLRSPDEVKTRVLIVCGQHGREYVSSEVCYALIRLLQLQARDDNFTTRLNLLDLNDVGIWIVPVANPWSRIRVESNETNSCRRTNANGVDLNRNFPYLEMIKDRKFENSPYSDDGISPEDNPGKEPLSEYETVAIVEYIDYINPQMIINVHSGSNDILLPYDYEIDMRPDHYRIMVELANHARKESCQECKVGTSSLLLYPARGTLIDYSLIFTNTQLAFTLEIYASQEIVNDHQLSPEECRIYFNPEHGEELLFILRKWIHFTLSLIEKLLKKIK
jgi:hypothetical protein